MKLTRLDEIIRRNVSYSSNHSKESQTVFVLNDISETLAMIYDKMCGLDSVTSGDVPVSLIANIVPYDELCNYETLFFQHIDYKEGYQIKFINYFQTETIDVKKNENNLHDFVLVEAFGETMQLKKQEYKKKWRCWNIEPTKEEKASPWEK